MQKISPFLWFDHQAEEAMNSCVSICRNSKVLAANHYGEAGPGPKGAVMTASFLLDGQEVQRGWLTDKFGVSRQIVPTLRAKLLGDPDPVKSARVMQAMLKMKKIDIAALQRALEPA